MTAEGNRASLGASHLSGLLFNYSTETFPKIIPSHFPFGMISSNNLLLLRQFQDMNAFLGVILQKKKGKQTTTDEVLRLPLCILVNLSR